jgi:hypothetical protein
MAHTTSHTMTREMQECIGICNECHSICLATVQHCLELGGKHAEPRHITLLLDSAEICQTSANFMLRGSELHGRTCGICGEVCLTCAEDCERLGQSDAQMQQCAQICRRCAESCQELARAM